jgi:hypothetical protein
MSRQLKALHQPLRRTGEDLATHLMARGNTARFTG